MTDNSLPLTPPDVICARMSAVPIQTSAIS
jgi:hypothetical protein